MSAAPIWANSTRPKYASQTVSLLQVVAYNLALGRRERQLTQDELGVLLERLTGRPWSRATVSAAESGWEHAGRVRQFDVNEVVAFALALRLPLAWFFLPPTERPDGAAVEPDLPWIQVNKAPGRKQVPAMTTEFVRWLVLHLDDPDDDDEVMARRLRRDGVSRGPEVDPERFKEFMESMSLAMEAWRNAWQSGDDR